MNSKEALKEILLEARFIFDYKTINGKRYTPQDLINTIKQDLKRLEILNKNFDKTLKTSVDLINKNLELQARLEMLEKENKKLNFENQALRKGIDLDLNAKLLSENEKLKNAIEILKKYLFSPIVNFDTFVTSNYDDAEINLLKEVLNND